MSNRKENHLVLILKVPTSFYTEKKCSYPCDCIRSYLSNNNLQTNSQLQKFNTKNNNENNNEKHDLAINQEPNKNTNNNNLKNNNDHVEINCCNCNQQHKINTKNKNDHNNNHRFEQIYFSLHHKINYDVFDTWLLLGKADSNVINLEYKFLTQEELIKLINPGLAEMNLIKELSLNKKIEEKKDDYT